MSSNRRFLLALLAVIPAIAVDESPAPILQWFESTYQTIEDRIPDVFMSGYGFVWVPPPFRADTSDQSVGYDVYDRFDLGRPGKPTLYGTEEGLKSLALQLHRAGLGLHIDFVMNHAGYSKFNTPGFVAAGGYPGLAITLPNDIDGDFHSAFQFGDQFGRLQGLLDIAQEKNHKFIRSPVTAGDGRNLKAGTAAAFGRIANVPDPANRRFYPQPGFRTIFLFDPKANESNIPVHSFDPANPGAGVPTLENGMGYLMRNAQWLIQVIGVDGLRIDAAKHVPGFVLDYIDRAVYRTNPRSLLDGRQSDVFTYSEVFDGNPAVLLPHVKKNINHADPGRIGGNRDTLDFRLYFALKEGLEQTAIPGAWQRIKDGALDLADDGLHNGSAGVTFVNNHDVFKPWALDHVAHAYTLLMPGNTAVYFNGQQFGDDRAFPKPGRGDAVSAAGVIKRLLAVRATHGRGNYAERWDGTDGLFAFERQGSALVLLSNRGDAGFDSRTLTGLSFRPGTLLVELSGNASDNTVNPVRNGNRDVPEVIRVFDDGGVSKVNIRFQRPGTIAPNGQFNFHGRGFLIYGLPTPSAPKGIELTNVASLMAGRTNPANGRENGQFRQTAVSVIRANSFDIRLETEPVRLLGDNSLRDRDADGDEALLRIDAGLDVNGNGSVDFRTPGTTEYGFERFVTKRDPLIRNGNPASPPGDGEFRQTVDATKLAEGMHYITVQAYRRQPAGSPAVFSQFRKVIYVDRQPPVAAVEGVRRDSANSAEISVRSTDGTADTVHVLVDVAAGTSDNQIQSSVTGGAGRLNRMDRSLFRATLGGLPAGTHTLTVVSFEPSGTRNIQRIPVSIP